MEVGQTVYKAYDSGWSSASPPIEIISVGKVVEVSRNGTTMLGVERSSGGGLIEPVTERWHEQRCDALRDHHRELVRYIGSVQAKADELAARILHEDLTAMA